MNKHYMKLADKLMERYKYVSSVGSCAGWYAEPIRKILGKEKVTLETLEGILDKHGPLRRELLEKGLTSSRAIYLYTALIDPEVNKTMVPKFKLGCK